MPVINWVTAISFLVALTVSVFANAHTPSVEPNLADQPCHGHEAPVEEDRWAEACDSLCANADVQVLGANGPERFDTTGDTGTMVTYGVQSLKTLRLGALFQSIHAHDPPGSDIYLITQRLRI